MARTSGRRVSTKHLRNLDCAADAAGRLRRAVSGINAPRALDPWRAEPLERRLLMAVDVVINEIMFNPGSRDAGDEYVELYNRGDAPANLAGWEFVRGISYNFPGGTLGAGQYLVVAANAAKFNALHPGVTNVVGGWTGRLSNGGERIELDDAAGVTVDQVRYSDQGDWATRGRQTFPIKPGGVITRNGSTATVTRQNHEL